MPADIEEHIEGKLVPDQLVINKWRYWKNDIKVVGKFTDLMGALDDCLLLDSSYYAPLDIKTRGSEKEDMKGYAVQYYQTQFDCYTYMLEENGFKTCSEGYAIFYWPLNINLTSEIFFKTAVVKLETSIERARKLFEQATEIVVSKNIPKANPTCEYCNFHEARGKIKYE